MRAIHFTDSSTIKSKRNIALDIIIKRKKKKNGIIEYTDTTIQVLKYYLYIGLTKIYIKLYRFPHMQKVTFNISNMYLYVYIAKSIYEYIEYLSVNHASEIYELHNCSF